MENQLIKEIVEEIHNKGFYIFKSLLSDSEIKDFYSEVKSRKPTVLNEFQKEAWGYGSFLEDSCAKPILKHENLKRILNEYIQDEGEFNHILVNSKAPLVGGNVEWHQELANIDTFAPGSDISNVSSFLQVYISLSGENRTNGGLSIVPYSHHEGFLKHIDILWNHNSHKREILSDELISVVNKYGLIYPELNPGDALIFGHLLIHSSGRNDTTLPRVSVVSQYRSRNIKERWDDNLWKKETKYRSDFVIEKLKDTIDIKLSNKNIYGEFKC